MTSSYVDPITARLQPGDQLVVFVWDCPLTDELRAAALDYCRQRGLEPQFDLDYSGADPMKDGLSCLKAIRRKRRDK